MESDRDVVVEVSLKLNDIYSPFRWERGNVFRWVAAIVLCLIFRDFYKDGRATLATFLGGESILAIVILLMVFVLMGLLLFPYLRIWDRFRKSPALTNRRRYTFRNAGITVESDDANGNFKWSLFQRTLETPNLFVFSQTSFTATYIPKSCFTSPDDIGRLRELVRENMPGKWRLRRI
jgi:YcxB-like protein